MLYLAEDCKRVKLSQIWARFCRDRLPPHCWPCYSGNKDDCPRETEQVAELDSVLPHRVSRSDWQRDPHGDGGSKEACFSLVRSRS